MSKPSMARAPALRTGRMRRACLIAGLGVATAVAVAQGAGPLAGGDIELGARLYREHRCAECHAARVGGDGNAIYRPQGRIDSPDRLRAMVENCSVQLKLQLFPEEIDALAALLNRDHYRFK